MTESDKQHAPLIPKNPSPEMTGKFVESDKKKLESAVVDKLKSLGSKLTRKEIQELLSHVETAKNIESLKEKLTTKTAERADDAALEEIFALYNEIRK
ncbi:MAG: hypothetical protein ACOYN2_06510 [Patescibacteria group bacterium]